MAREKDQPSAQFMQRKNTRIVLPLLPSNILLTAWDTHCAVLCFFAKTFQCMYLKYLKREQEGMGKRETLRTKLMWYIGLSFQKSQARLSKSCYMNGYLSGQGKPTWDFPHWSCKKKFFFDHIIKPLLTKMFSSKSLAVGPSYLFYTFYWPWICPLHKNAKILWPIIQPSCPQTLDVICLPVWSLQQVSKQNVEKWNVWCWLMYMFPYRVYFRAR